MACPTPITLKTRSKSGSLQIVPCGLCGNCLEQRRTYWTFRIHEELRNHASATFITLTYAITPLSKQNVPTLEKKALQDFFKRLRHYLGKRQVRYYAVGEYGTQTQRPHYHAIIFGLDTKEIEYIQKAWPLGHSTATPVNDARIHYVTKYHLNYTPKSDRPTNRQDEFALMSRNPGIGSNYLERAKEYHLKTENMFVVLNGYKYPMPKYYYDKLWKDEFTRQRLTSAKLEAAEKSHQKKLYALKSRGYENPELENFQRQIEKGIQYKRKKDSDRGL